MRKPGIVSPDIFSQSNRLKIRNRNRNLIWLSSFAFMCIKFKSSFSSKIATVLQESRTLLSSYTKNAQNRAVNRRWWYTHTYHRSFSIYRFLRYLFLPTYPAKWSPLPEIPAQQAGDSRSHRWWCDLDTVHSPRDAWNLESLGHFHVILSLWPFWTAWDGSKLYLFLCRAFMTSIFHVLRSLNCKNTAIDVRRCWRLTTVPWENVRR